MTFEADLKSHLQTGDIAAQVGDRIRPLPLMQKESMPAISYTVIEDAPQTDLDGEDGELNNIRVQVDCWAATHDAAKALAELVRVRMKTAASSFSAVPVAFFQEFEPETRRHRVSRDFSCWYRIT